MIRARAAALILLTALTTSGLTGCTGGAAPAPSDSRASSPSQTPSVSPSPTTEARVEVTTDPGTWIIDDAGVGPIEIGGDFTATLDGLAPGWTNDAVDCSWSAWWTASDSAYRMSFVRGTESPSAPIREISVSSTSESLEGVPGPQTMSGLGVGATRDDLLAAYPAAQQGTSTIGSDRWIMLPSETDAHVFFAFREGADTAWDVTVTTGAEPSYEACG